MFERPPTGIPGYSGTLQKRATTGIFKGRFQARYFKLSGHYITYYKSESAANETPLAAIDVVSITSAMKASNRSDDFILVFNDGTLPMHLRAESAIEADTWIDCVNASQKRIRQDLEAAMQPSGLSAVNEDTEQQDGIPETHQGQRFRVQSSPVRKMPTHALRSEADHLVEMLQSDSVDIERSVLESRLDELRREIGDRGDDSTDDALPENTVPIVKRRGFRGSVFERPPDAFASVSGYLFKHGAGGLLARWQRRWFEIRTHYLAYFSKKPASGSEAPLGAIDLRLCNSVHFISYPTSDAVFTLFVSGNDGKQGQKVHLKAESREHAQVWVKAISSFTLRQTSLTKSQFPAPPPIEPVEEQPASVPESSRTGASKEPAGVDVAAMPIVLVPTANIEPEQAQNRDDTADAAAMPIVLMPDTSIEPKQEENRDDTADAAAMPIVIAPAAASNANIAESKRESAGIPGAAAIHSAMLAADTKITEAQAELEKAFLDLAEREQQLLCQEEASAYATNENAVLTRKLLMARAQLHAAEQESAHSSTIADMNAIYSARIRDLENEIEDRRRDHEAKTEHLKNMFVQMHQDSLDANRSRRMDLSSEFRPMLSDLGIRSRVASQSRKHYYLKLSDLRAGKPSTSSSSMPFKVRVSSS